MMEELEPSELLNAIIKEEVDCANDITNDDFYANDDHNHKFENVEDGGEAECKDEKPLIKQKRIGLNLAQKNEVLNRLENGATMAELALEYGVSYSCILDIKRRKKQIRKFIKLSGSNITSVSRQRLRPGKYNELEKELVTWIFKENKKGVQVTNENIISKAYELFDEIYTDATEKFSASDSWVARFKRRHSITNGKVAGEIDENDEGDEDEDENNGDQKKKKTKNIEFVSLTDQNETAGSSDLADESVRGKKKLSVKDKYDILQLIKRGVSKKQIAKKYNVVLSTINRVKRQEKVIIKFFKNTSSDGKRRKTLRQGKYAELEEKLHDWLSNELNENDSQPISDKMIMEQARIIYSEIYNETDEEFPANHAWLSRFKVRYGIKRGKKENDDANHEDDENNENDESNENDENQYDDNYNSGENDECAIEEEDPKVNKKRSNRNIKQESPKRSSKKLQKPSKFDQALLKWCVEQANQNLCVTSTKLIEEAKRLSLNYDDMEDIEFDQDWFLNFTKRYNIKLSKKVTKIEEIDNIETTPDIPDWNDDPISVNNYSDFRMQEQEQEQEQMAIPHAKVVDYLGLSIQWAIENNVDSDKITALQNLRNKAYFLKMQENTKIENI